MHAIGTNKFSLSYYENILSSALHAGYKITSLKDFWDAGCPKDGHFVLRHDLDHKPHTLNRMLDVERKVGCRSTIYVRMVGSPYNIYDYSTFRVLKHAAEDGFDIGLHTSYCEFSEILHLKKFDVLSMEIQSLKSFFDVQSIAPHRDINYAYNSLPHIQLWWTDINELGLKFQAYDSRILDATTYINEGFDPHLCWRMLAPEDVIPTGKSIYMLTHPHWWYLNHPFEEWDEG